MELPETRLLRGMRLSLRLQLLVFGALTLLLPWIGVQIVKELEVSLRGGLEELLAARASIIVDQLDLSALDATPETSAAELPFYAHSLSRQPRLDGTRDNWSYRRDPSIDSTIARSTSLGDDVQVWLGADTTFLYLFIAVSDDDFVFQAGPGIAPYGDRVALLFGEPGSERTLLLAGEAPGLLRAQRSSGAPDFVPDAYADDTTRAFLSLNPSGTGYVLEARIALRLVGDSLGIAVIDTDSGGDEAMLLAASWSGQPTPSALLREIPSLNGQLGRYPASGSRYRIVNGNGLVLAESGQVELPDANTDQESLSLVEQVFRNMLRRDEPLYSEFQRRPGLVSDDALLGFNSGEAAAAWYRGNGEDSTVVAVATPLDPTDPGRGALVLEQAGDLVLSGTDRVLLRLVLLMVLVSLVAAAALLTYASVLSFRVSRLARAAESALGPGGEINTALPGSRARDEIGDLSRSYQDLLQRLSDYTDYLQSLKSKLSHEIRTPLAIVSTSLDNLEHGQISEADQPYLARLREGATRLENILAAMTAATRVEQALHKTTPERFELALVVESCVLAYRDVYPSQVFNLELPGEKTAIDGSAELIAQLLDKLIDNAVGFAEEGTGIDVSITVQEDLLVLDVVNRGQLLPEAMRHQLFDSLVSMRESKTEKPHLGLGLYIASLVAEFHGGRIEAGNLEDGSGVRMRVWLAGLDAGSA